MIRLPIELLIAIFLAALFVFVGLHVWLSNRRDSEIRNLRIMLANANHNKDHHVMLTRHEREARIIAEQRFADLVETIVNEKEGKA